MWGSESEEGGGVAPPAQVETEAACELPRDPVVQPGMGARLIPAHLRVVGNHEAPSPVSAGGILHQGPQNDH